MTVPDQNRSPAVSQAEKQGTHETAAASAAPGDDPIALVGVVGAGTMGAGIAEVCAVAGLDVQIAVSSPESADRGRARIAASLDRAVKREKLTAAARAAALDRVRFTTDLADLADRDLVVEAVREDEAAKLDIFAALDKILLRPDAILASNTSSIPIMRLARGTGRAEHVIGLHFFNPVPALGLVELIGSLATDPATLDRAEAFVAGRLGKSPVRCADRSGFIVNALLIPFLLAAIRMVESGHGTAERIDEAMVLGCAHPLGPLKLADLIGLDVVGSIADALYAEFKEPHYARPPLLSRKIEAGQLGRKAAQGFYAYS